MPRGGDMHRAAWLGIVFVAFGCTEVSAPASSARLLEDADLTDVACASSANHAACAEVGGVGSTCAADTPLCCFEGASGGICVDDLEAVSEPRRSSTLRDSAPPSPGGGGGGFNTTPCDGTVVCRDVLVCVPAPITDKNLGCTFETRTVCSCIKTA
jgi:hypothetical protein